MSSAIHPKGLEQAQDCVRLLIDPIGPISSRILPSTGILIGPFKLIVISSLGIFIGAILLDISSLRDLIGLIYLKVKPYFSVPIDSYFWTNYQIKMSLNLKTSTNSEKLVQIQKPVQIIRNEYNSIEYIQKSSKYTKMNQSATKLASASILLRYFILAIFQTTDLHPNWYLASNLHQIFLLKILLS